MFKQQNIVWGIAHRGHWWRRLQRTQNRPIQTNTILLCKDEVGSVVEPTSSLVWADVILADFQRVVSRYLQDISTYLSCTAQIILRTISMRKYKPKYACLPSKIVEVCVRFDWWRRLPTSSVSPMWIGLLFVVAQRVGTRCEILGCVYAMGLKRIIIPVFPIKCGRKLYRVYNIYCAQMVLATSGQIHQLLDNCIRCFKLVLTGAHHWSPIPLVPHLISSPSHWSTN